MPQNSVLAGGGAAHLGLSACGPLEPGQVDEERQDSFSLVFPLDGVFRVDDGRGIVTATPAKVLFFGQGRSQLISHPTGGHDTSLYISVAPELVAQFLDDRGTIPCATAATRPESDFELRSMLRQAHLGQLAPLAIEDFAMETLHLLVNTNSAERVTPERRRLVDATEEYLWAHFRSNCDLPTISRAVGASPHHLSRVFKEVTGESLARRRMRLRLNEAMRQISQGAGDLSAVAVESGFYDHSHLTN
ncbi:MAG: AraC family transcriptional regulator, partial [Acidimicrobiia bacterium]